MQIFGPVQSIIKFKELKDAIERANKTNYGLAAGILSKDISTALTTAHALRAGTIWLVKKLYHSNIQNMWSAFRFS